MSASTIKSLRMKKGPVLAQKRVDWLDYHGILVRFNGEIGLRPISILNMTKVPFANLPISIWANFNRGNVTIYKWGHAENAPIPNARFLPQIWPKYHSRIWSFVPTNNEIIWDPDFDGGVSYFVRFSVGVNETAKLRWCAVLELPRGAMHPLI